MKKLTVKEASEFLGITREAIYNRIRRGGLKCVTEANIKYVIIEDEEISSKQTPPSKTQTNSTNYEEYLKEQISELKDELKESKETINKLYKEKDEQLRYIFQITLQSQQKQLAAQVEESVIEASIKPEKKWIKLSKLLKSLDFNKAKRAKVQRKISKKMGTSKNIKMKNDKLYVNKHKRFKEIYEN